MRPVVYHSDTIHIWKVFLDINQSQFSDQHPQDLELSKRYSNKKEQEFYLLSRGWLRYILSHYIGESAQASLAFTNEGKPYFPISSWNFNLSHSHNCLLVAVAYLIPVGIDVEKMREDIEFEAVAELFMNEFELNIFKKFPQEKKKEAFFDLWVRKEAYGKLRGVGLLEDPRGWHMGFAPREFSCDPSCHFLLFSLGVYRAALAFYSDHQKKIEFITP